MKKLILVFLILLIAIAGLLGYLAYNANNLLAKFTPQIEELASSTISAPVRLSELSVSVIPTPKIKIGNATVGGGSDGAGLSLKNLSLALNPWSLLKGKLEVSELLISGPQIATHRRNSVFYIEGLNKSQSSSSIGTPSGSSVAASNDTTKGGSSIAPIAIALRRFVVEDGVLTLTDHDQKKSYVINDIEIDGGLGISSDKITIPYLEVGAELPGKLPLQLSAQELAVNPQSGDVSSKSIKVQYLGNSIDISPNINIKTNAGTVVIAGSGINLASLTPVFKEFAPGLLPLQMTGQVRPDIKTQFNLSATPPLYSSSGKMGLEGLGMNIGGTVLAGINGGVALNVDQRTKAIRTENLSLLANGEKLTLSVAAEMNTASQESKISSLRINGLGGTIAGGARVSLALNQRFASQLQAQKLDLNKLLSLLPQKPTFNITGELSTLTSSMEGQLSGDIKRSLRGKVGINLRNGALAGTNIAGTVIKQLTTLPFFPPSVYQGLAPETKAALDGKDTRIDSMSGNFQVADGIVRTSDLVIINPLFRMEGSGQASLDGALDFNSTIIFTPDFSAMLVRSAKDISKVLDEQKRLVVPLRITGKAGSITVLPNTQKIGELAAKKALEKGLEQLLKGGGKEGEKKKGLGGLLGRL